MIMKKLYFTIKEPSINELRNWKTKGKLLTNPDYQRDYVYTEEKASRLVESALMLILIPTVYLCKKENNIYYVLMANKELCLSLSLLMATLK